MPFDKIQSFLEINPEYAWLLLFLFGFMESMIITGSFMSSAILFSICIYLYNSGILTLPWICGFALLGSHFGDVVGFLIGKSLGPTIMATKFIQKISVLSKTPYVSGSMSYQVCSDIERKCIPLENEFNFYSKGSFESEVVLNTIKQNSDLSSLFSFLFFSFIAGLLAILTPCVFPMIPITVSYFANKNNQIKTFSEALFYGVSIVLIFTFLGVILSALLGPQTANELATAWIPNILFFVLFVIFGISLMGFFELTIPSSLITSMDKKSEQGGYLGVFFMAFTLVLVSFSCTGPLIGSILVQSASGLQIKPILGMLFFFYSFCVSLYFVGDLP